MDWESLTGDTDQQPIAQGKDNFPGFVREMEEDDLFDILNLNDDQLMKLVNAVEKQGEDSSEESKFFCQMTRNLSLTMTKRISLRNFMMERTTGLFHAVTLKRLQRQRIS